MIVLAEPGVMLELPVKPAAVKVKAPELMPVMLLTVPIFNEPPLTKVILEVPMLAASVETLFEVLDRLYVPAPLRTTPPLALLAVIRPLTTELPLKEMYPLVAVMAPSHESVRVELGPVITEPELAEANTGETAPAALVRLPGVGAAKLAP